MCLSETCNKGSVVRNLSDEFPIHNVLEKMFYSHRFSTLVQMNETRQLLVYANDILYWVKT